MDIKNTLRRLDELMTSPIPNFQKIETAIREIPPALLAIAIQEDASFAYLLDYYLRFMDINTVKQILQNPTFTHEALLELFYCQITSYHKAVLQKKPLPDLSASYWSCLSKAEYAIIFKNILKQPSNLKITQLLIEKLDTEHIKLMLSTGVLKSKIMLDFFKQIGQDIKKLAAIDMNFFDVAFSLAVHESDFDYLLFLEDYTTLFVQLRVASFTVDEFHKYIEKHQVHPDYHEMIVLLESVPGDSLQITLDLLKDKGLISQPEHTSLNDFFQNKRNSRSNR
jgi:hypothetical protein